MTSNPHNGHGKSRLAAILPLYYAATAIFLILDYYLGLNLRLAALDAYPGWRAIYYVFCFACLGLMLWRPALSALVTTIESLITLAMLIITMGVRVMTYSDVLLSGRAGFITSEEIINFVIAGGFAWFAYMRGAEAVRREIGMP